MGKNKGKRTAQKQKTWSSNRGSYRNLSQTKKDKVKQTERLMQRLDAAQNAKAYEGLVLQGIGGLYMVDDHNGHSGLSYARGILRYDQEKLMVGDYVNFFESGDPDVPWYIDSISPRKNYLQRPAIANIDCLVLVFSVKTPDLDLLLLDKLICIARAKGIPVRLVFTKIDLASIEELERIRLHYIESAFPVYFLSNPLAKQDDSQPEPFQSFETEKTLLALTQVLKGHLIAFAGPSGSGKSSLLNLMSGESLMDTGGISQKLKRGKHTTRKVALFPFLGGYIADTPGFTRLELQEAGISPESVVKGFPEFESQEEACRFIACKHLEEPDCAVKKQGEKNPQRLQHYQYLRKSLEDIPHWQR